MLEHHLEESQHIELFLPCALHVYEEEDAVMAAQQAHESCILEKLRARLLAVLISGLE
jgi:uncharacterized protein (DUF302 family)